MEKKKKNTRFVRTYSEGKMGTREVWVDRETGVNYLYLQYGYSGGLTPLLDAEGNPVVTPIADEN